MESRGASPMDERDIASREHARLYAILDSDPSSAVAAARALKARAGLARLSVTALRAAIFIDAGAALGDSQLVNDGIQLIRSIPAAASRGFAYNLANGLSVLASLTEGDAPGALHTTSLRREAKILYERAARESSDISTQSSSLTNLANLLKHSCRWVEAYDAYAAALEHDPSNAIALSGISSVLRWRMGNQVNRPGPLRRVAVRYLLRAHANIERAQRYAGPKGKQKVLELMQLFGVRPRTKQPKPEAPPPSDYAAFVRRHRLALCLEPEGPGADLRRWDDLSIHSIREPMDEESRVPTIFTSWNVLKSEYLTARWLAFESLTRDFHDTGFYSDTLDYANYGIRSSALVLAQRAAVDVLDKIAVAATDYLKLPGNPERVYFTTRWHVMDPKIPNRFAAPDRWQPEIATEITAGNLSLMALAELAHDYATGHLHPKKKTRNAGTHRFVVMHDMLIEGHSRPASFIERHGETEFVGLVIESLQVARAAMMYFSEIVAAREHRLHENGTPTVSMIVPSHHWVRGEDDARGQLSKREREKGQRRASAALHKARSR